MFNYTSSASVRDEFVVWFLIPIGRRIVAGRRSQEWLSGTTGRLFRINEETRQATRWDRPMKLSPISWASLGRFLGPGQDATL